MYRAAGIQRQEVHGSHVGDGVAAAVVLVGSDCQVRHAVAVHAVHGCHGKPKVICQAQRGAVCYAAVDLHGVLYSAVAVHQHEVHGARL